MSDDTSPTVPDDSPTPRTCARCDETTSEPVLVREVHQMSGPGFNVYACPDCAPHFPPVQPQLEALERLIEVRRRRARP